MTTLKYVLAGFLVVVLALGCSTVKKITKKSQVKAPLCWVYKVIPVKSDQTLNALGRDGWEAFSTTMMETASGFVLWAALRKPLRPCKAETASPPTRTLQRLVPPS